MATEQYDVIVVGGGMVGSMLAVAAGTAACSNGAPLRVCVIEENQPDPFVPGSDPPYDLRVSALSIASQRMLQNTGSWQGIVERRACPYRRLRVRDGERGGETEFNAADTGDVVLGHIVENRVIQLALHDRLATLDAVSLRCPAKLASWRHSGKGLSVQLDDGSDMTTRVLVGADGARSVIRQRAGITLDRHQYPQHALVASIATALPQQDITWQRFVPSGAQAFLPLCGSRASMVWYHSEQEIARLLALPDDAFIEALCTAFPAELGEVTELHGRASFPIARSHAQRYADNRVVLVGDAAHTVHPLAGQGVNIGLLDAATLAGILLEVAARGRDIGDDKYLMRYDRWRRGENALMIHALDAIYRGFSDQPEFVKRVRSAALNAVDKNGVVKRLLMRHAMGVSGDLPAVAKPAI